MAVDLQHTGEEEEDTTSSEFLPYEEEEEDDDLLSHSQAINDKEDDLIAELTHHMDRFFQLQDHHDDDDHKFELSAIGGGYRNSELSWDLIGSPQSTLLWSPMMGSTQGSSEGSSQEASPPPTPGISSRQYYPPNHTFNPSINIGPSSHQSLIHQQIRAIELSRVKQEQVRLLKQKFDASNGESEETQNSARRRTGPSPPMRAAFLGGSSASRGGTGVFLPRSASASSQSTNKKQGKGCSTVLIPARVVQALQQHFDQMATASGPKPAFPPLHGIDVLVSNRDGMYSLQKRQSRKSQSNHQNITTLPLPQDWTY